MKEDLDKQFPEPIKYKDGADMSGETFHALGASLGFPTMLSENGGKSWIDPHFNPIIGIEIHIVPSLPFGAVEECRCEDRAKGIEVHITSIVPPESGWPIVAHCDLCKKTVIVLSPWAIKPEDGDYWKMNGTCLDEDLN